MFKEFKDRRKEAKASSFSLSSNSWDIYHRVDIKLFKQEYSIRLDDPTVDDIFMFYLDPLKHPRKGGDKGMS